MKRLLCIAVIAISHVSFVNAQTTYFGKVNSVEIRYNAAPSLKPKIAIDGIGQDQMAVQKRRIVNSSYALRLNRILNNKVSLSLGFELAGIRSITSEIEEYKFPENQNLGTVTHYFIEPNINYRGFSVGLNFFGASGINPLGIRGGITLEYGSMISDYSELTVFETGNFDTELKNIVGDSLRVEDFSKYQSTKVNVVAFRWNIGKNFVLSRKMLLKFDLSSNLFTFFPGNKVSSYDRFEVIDNSFSFSYYQDRRYDLENRSFREQEFKGFRRSYLSYKRLTLSLGLSYFF